MPPVRAGSGTRARRAALRPLVVLGLPAAFGACAYFNGVYNAKEADQQATRLLRGGRESEAAGSFAVAAAKAETVLVRHPKTRWRGEALYLAGRGFAYSNQCERATGRLTEFLALTGQPAERRDRATLALATCSYHKGKHTEALTLLDPLTRSRKRDIATQASLWAARSAIRLGNTGKAQRYLGAIDAGVAQWELAAASIAEQEYPRAESLLALRARSGDYRDDLPAALKALWAAGRQDQVETIVSRYDRAGGAASEKAALHLMMADLEMQARRDSMARLHLLAVPRATSDTVARKEAASRLTALRVRELSSLALVEDAIVKGAEVARGTALQTRLEDNLLLVKILERRRDISGAALFLAAEVARDSLGSRGLAHALFKRIENEIPTALLAPKALLAAAELLPDSAPVYHQRIRTRYPTSPFRLLLDGGDPANAITYRQADVALMSTWRDAAKVAADSITARRPQPSTANAPADSVVAGRGPATGSASGPAAGPATGAAVGPAAGPDAGPVAGTAPDTAADPASPPASSTTPAQPPAP
jgi:hypothetical protein